MSEVWFYHLEGVSLERVLPDLLEKTLARKWRALVKCGAEERLDALDAALWTYRDDTFLPHGRANERTAERQPILLTLADDNPNGANVLFLVDGAACDDPSPFERCISVFDGRDEAAVEQARGFWKSAKAQGHEISYWRRAPEGGWRKQS
ncbi:MAG: DNA polymerase III subunit chi [Pseudomonadota bacterium]